MTESFAELFEDSIKDQPKSSEIQKGKVIRITDKYVIVDAGYKSESYMDVAQFKNAAGELTIAVGDDVDVMVESYANETGSTELSHEKAKKTQAWNELEKIYEDKAIVEGVINQKAAAGSGAELIFLPRQTGARIRFPQRFS